MKLLAILFSSLLLVACGGGTEPTASLPVAAIKTTVLPVKKATTVTGGNAVVIHMYQALYGMAPSNALLVDYAFQANNDASTFVKNLTDRFASTSHADLAKRVLDNLGVSPTTVTAINAKGEGEYALLLDAVKQLFTAYPTMRGQVILNMTNLLAGLESDATYGATAAIYNVQARANLAYSSNIANSSTTASSSQDVVCSVQKNNYGDVTYPPEYLGAFPIPMPNGRLPSSIVRTMNLQDVDAWWEKPANSQCTSPDIYRTNAIIEDLNRVQQLGVERVWVYNYAHWDDFSKPIWNAVESDYALPRSVLQTVVSEAHKRNIKVYYAYQFAFNCDAKEVCLDPQNLLASDPQNISTSDLSKLLKSFKRQIISDATFGAQIGLDGIKINLDAYNPKTAPNYNSTIRELYVSEVTSAIDSVRSVFNGKVVYGLYDPVYDNRIFLKIDELILSLFLAHTVDPFSVSAWNKDTTNFISYFQYWIQQESGVQKINVPIAWEIYSESAKEFYTSSWLDSFCTKTMIVQNQCPQQSFATDFSMQAIAIEGSLEALSNQSTFSTGSVSFYHYFHNDDIAPTDLGGAINYPNIDASIRNKPAEGIVKYWFGR